jgi:hypothetical protein
VDLDLHARARPGADWLFFGRTEPSDRSNGRVDLIAQAPVRGEPAIESIIFAGPVDLRELSATVNFFEGTSPGGVPLIVRLWMAGHNCAWEMRARVPAARGNRGQGDRAGAEWVSINVLQLVGVSR